MEIGRVGKDDVPEVISASSSLGCYSLLRNFHGVLGGRSIKGASTEGKGSKI